MWRLIGKYNGLHKKKVIKGVEGYRELEVIAGVTSGCSCLISITLNYLFLVSCVHVLYFWFEEYSARLLKIS